MSEDITSGVVQGGDAISPEAGANAADPNSQGPTTYTQRLRSDPEFAERMVRELQSEKDKLQDQVSKNQGLNHLAEKYGADKVEAYINDYMSLASDPDLVQGILHYRQHRSFPGQQIQGNSSNGQETGMADEYITDEERQVKQQLDSLNGQVRALESKLASQSSSISRSRFAEQLAKTSNEIGLSQEQHQRVMESLGAKLDAWSQAASRGDMAGEAAIQNLMGPDPGKFVMSAVMSELTPNDFEDIQRTRSLRRQEQVGRYETDGLSPVPTTGTESSPDMQGWSPGEIARWAASNPDKHSSA